MDVRTTVTLVFARTLGAATLVALAALLVLGLTPASVSAAAPRSSTTLAEPIYQGSVSVVARATLGLSQPGSGGWFWPVGTEAFKGWSGWLEKRGSYVHVAQDMPCAVGHPVYAIGDGVVFISRANAGGYGVGGAPGGCIIIAHETAAGTRFHALYGHLSGLKVKAGQKVSAGQVIARVNGCRHLHFSIHVGFKYRDGNPYAGHVPASWADHGGYVDPVSFLKTNPRAAPYRPPALPMVDITTQGTPQQFGAAEGVAYWTEDGGGASWRQALAGGAPSELPAGETPPPFDTRRYQAALLTAPAVGFSIADRLPDLSLQTVCDTPRWGANAKVRALLANAAGAPIPGGVLKLQRKKGDVWRNVILGVTDAHGAATLLYRPTVATQLRLVFAPPEEQPAGCEYLVARTEAATVAPHVKLTTPRVPPIARRGALVTVAGLLTPEHAAGDHTIQLVFQRRGAGAAYVTKVTVAAVNRDIPRSSATRYVGHARLAAGSWRVRAVHPADDLHAHTGTSWRLFAVR